MDGIRDGVNDKAQEARKTIVVMYPYMDAMVFKSTSGAFFWFNVSNTMGFLAAISYLVNAFVLAYVTETFNLDSSSMSMIVFGLGWMFILLDLSTLLAGAIGAVFYVMAAHDEGSVLGAFKTFGLSMTGVCTWGLIGWSIKAITFAFPYVQSLVFPFLFSPEQQEATWLRVVNEILFYGSLIPYLICFLCLCFAIYVSHKISSEMAAEAEDDEELP